MLIVDDDVDVLSAAKLLLKRNFEKVEIEKNPEKIPFLLNNYTFDLILLDMNFMRDVNTGKEGFEWLDKILDLNPKQKVILFTAYGDVEMAVRAIKSGATDFVLKPWENDKLLAAILTALGKSDEPEVEQAVDDWKSDIIGNSEAMQKVFDTIERVAQTDANILILGENGTGKDLIAKAVHKLSKRADKAYVQADLGAVSETLFESELFGHKKGAFTDAKEDRIGRFEEASGGTIFLDEIGNIPLTLQSKLLTVIQNRTVTQVGSNKQKNIDVRLITATNEPIYDRVQERSFRQDLLFRINTIEIHLPPLRDRENDIVLIAEHFLNVYKKKYNRKITGVSAALAKKMMHYPWPGNVRELQHAIERAVIMTQNTSLMPEDFFIGNNQQQSTTFEETFQLEEMEKQLVIKTMKKFSGNITEAAKEMGISRQALYRRIEKYEL
ncbi:MAG: sigma-54 dependent transcriptional regulator [Spirosomaceae bacterium]|nr:sigma-54 dependent transcriptional regulator [Spirosomataceae bacterium]